MAAGDQIARVGVAYSDSVTLVGSTGNPAAGLTITTDFSRYGASNTPFTPTWTDVGSGEYSVAWTPTATGTHRIAAHTTYQDIFVVVEVAPASARADEPFAYRLGDTVFDYTYFSDVAVAAGSWSLQYARDPDNSAFTPTLTHVGSGEYQVTFVSTKDGRYRASWTYLGRQINLDVLVLTDTSQTGSGLTQAALRREIAARLGILETGVLTTGGSTTVVDTSRYEEDGFFTGGSIYITSGTAAGLQRRITGWTNSTATFTVSPAFSPSAVIGDTYEVYAAKVRLEDINRAINAAIRNVYSDVLTAVRDETLVTVARQYEYAVPAGFNLLAQVWLNNAAVTSEWQLLNPSNWQIMADPTTPKVSIRADLIDRVPAGSTIRLIGQQYAASLTTDAAATVIPSNYIVAWAAGYLLRSRSLGTGDPHDRERRGLTYQQEAQAIWQTSAPARSVMANARLVRP